jgi:hypothetical protein
LFNVFNFEIQPLWPLRSYVPGCDGNCGILDPPQSECRASFRLDPGTT